MSENNGKRQSKRPVARDISESLGKLPPQALDLEESIIGGCILEDKGFPLIKEFMRAEFFHSEAHQIIFDAMVELSSKGDGINMRSVSHTLKKNGKLELVGGAYYVAELTSKVASAANIEYDCRIVMEMYLKRQLISLASKVHQDAYDDSTDPLLLFKETFEAYTDLENKVFKSSGPQKIAALWKELLLTTEPEEMPPVLFIDGVPIAWPGGHSLLVGKKKSRKTLFVVWLIAQFLQRKDTTGEEVLVFDTEQSKRHVYAIRKKIEKMTGKKVAVFYLRGRAPQYRVDFIRETVKHWPTPPALIVIDGVRDLMVDINDPEESTNTSLFVEQLTLTTREGAKYPPHVIDILHLNKSDSNPRGHIGTELQNKAECTILLDRPDGKDFTDVKCESSREKPFNPFSFTHDGDDLPEVVVNTGQSSMTEDDSKVRLKEVFENEMLSYKELLSAIKVTFGDGKPLGTNRAQSLLAKCLRNGWILKSGKNRDPKTKYKLAVTPGDHISYAPPKPSPQLELTPVPAEVDEIDLPF